MKCSVEGCLSKHHSHGYCAMHWARFKRNGTPDRIKEVQKGKTCLVEGCNEPAFGKGRCMLHRNRFRRYGRDHVVIAKRGTGRTVNGQGYIVIERDKRKWLEHVWIATKAMGKPLPPKAIVHHVNGDKTDNSPSNLVVCPNQAYHILLHQRTDLLHPSLMKKYNSEEIQMSLNELGLGD